MFRSTLGVSVFLGLSLSLVTCGRSSGTNDEARERPGEAARAPTSGSGIVPCELLSAEQVATVLSGSDDGYVAKDGGSLIEGVDSYQCSYSNSDTDLFTVLVTVATDDERFESIEPNPSTRRQMYPDSFRDVNIGSGGWLAGEPDDMKLTAMKGRAVIELELMSSDAGEKGDALIELASSVAAKLP